MTDMIFREGITQSGYVSFGSASIHGRTSAYYERIRKYGYHFAAGVNPHPIDNPPEQIMKWTCIRCRRVYGSFREYLYDGCGMYGYGTNKRLEGV